MDQVTRSRRSFFDLPAELRNFVYRDLARATPIDLSPKYFRNGYYDKYLVSSYLEPTLLLVNKQFKLEYEREIFKHALLICEIPISTHKYGLPSIPTIPGYAFVSLRNINYTVKVDSWKLARDHLDEKYALIRRFCFPALAYLNIRFVAESHMFEHWLQSSVLEVEMPDGAAEIFHRIQWFSEKCETTFPRARVQCGFFVHTELFDMLESYNWTDLLSGDPNILRLKLSDLERNKENYVLFRASLGNSDDRYLWHGIKLEVENSGKADLDGLVEVVDSSYA